MTKYTVRSCVIIIPKGSVDDLKALAAVAGGYDLGLSVPLSASGTAPATHYGCHCTILPEFLDYLKGRSPKTKAKAKSERKALVKPTPLTEQELASIRDQEAALEAPTDPDSETYQADLEAYHDALEAIRAPLNAYRAALRAHRVQTKKLLEHERRDAKRELWQLAADAELNRRDLAKIRAKGIISQDPEVNGEVLSGRAHFDYVASNNNLQVIEGDPLPSE
jgi:hypothetical protein